ncbi:MAG: hypothetical protein AVDCRST_MAG77-2049 [uncultured Chloroflexi bacterium]|uniref:Uncharacterized protein n=1 Tax=uncultured Chloroflexota bacterium TaxID=166587 RepID=A0A6J4IH78_9CHLR|nr:MAG: hypothetical protein AVDCRST_MAG77-2049 [uncultured Chloroflexota bacterium]
MHALAIDRVPHGWQDDDEEDDEPPLAVPDVEIQALLESRGQPVNMATAIIARACLSYRRRESRGPALSDKYPATAPDGQPVVRQTFTGGIAEYDPQSGLVSWVEVVLHPETLPATPDAPAAVQEPVPSVTAVTGGATDATVPSAEEDDIMRLLQITPEELKAYFNRILGPQGLEVNLDTAIMKRAVLAHRRNEGRGPATSDEYPP